MQINSAQIAPGPSLFQALQSGPKADVKPQEEKPVAEAQNQAAVKAGEKSAPSTGARGFARGSLDNLQV